jgi:hypothetical protein
MIRYLTVSFTLQANGIVGDLVHMERDRAIGGPHTVGTHTQRDAGPSGVVTATDQVDLSMLSLPPGGGANIQYELSFNKKVPTGGLTISVRVQPGRKDSGVASAGPYQSSILGGLAQTAPTQTATPTPNSTPSTADAPSATDATDAAAAPTVIGGSGSDGGGSSGGMWLAYTIGALLLLGGVGVIGTMLWRRGQHNVETEWAEDGSWQQGQPAYAGQPGYAAPAQPQSGYAPTQVYGAPTQVPNYSAPTEVANYGAPTQVYGAPTPATYGAPGLHSTPTSQFPPAQDPYAEPDQTWVDPRSGR